MKGYLQRLFDGAGTGAPPALHPTQRSQSPLVALDQRLASPEFTGNFEIGNIPDAPPLAGQEPEGGTPRATPPIAPPRAILDLSPLTPNRERDEASRGDSLAPAAPTPVADPAGSRADAPDPARPVPTPPAAESRAKPAGPAALPDIITSDLPPFIREVTREQAPRPPAAMSEKEAQPLPKARTTTEPQNANEQPPAAPSPLPIAPPLRAPLPRLIDRPPEGHAPMQAAAPAAQPVRPAPPAMPEPLPPPAPAAVEWRDIAPRVEALVRETLARERPSMPRPGADTAPASAPGQSAPPRPATAEAASVIGPIERPPRHVMLFGSRLR